MNLTRMKDAAKKAFCGQGGGSVLLRRFGALVLALCLLAAIPMDAAADGPAPAEATSEPAPIGGSNGDLAFVSGITSSADEKDRTDLRNFLTGLTITDSEGKTVEPEGGTLYVGEKYTIHLQFGERGQQSLQFDDESDTLTYQIPKAFKIDPVKDKELRVEVDGKEVLLGYYSIDDEGKLTLSLTPEGKEMLKNTSALSFAFDMSAEAVPLTDSGDGTVDFGGAGESFRFEIVDQPLVDVTKEGKYAELGREGGELSYTVTTKVKHGQVKDVVLTDEFTPPQSDAFVLDGGPENVTVTFKRKNAAGEEESIELTSPEDYELVQVPDSDNPGKKTFQVKLKGDYANMQEGDEVSVTYDYAVGYNEKSSTGKLWAEVKNEATVNGKMVTEGPEDPEDPPKEQEFTEKDKNSVEMRVTPPGKGIVSKDQSYSEYTKTLHYTLYTTVPAGTWAPLYIFDDMVVKYQGEKWYLPEFKADGTGRVKNLQVHAADLPDGWFDGLDDSANDAEKFARLEETIKAAKASEPLKGYQLEGGDFDWNWPDLLAGYNSKSVEEYVARLGGQNLNIVFGYQGWKQPNHGEWGSWKYENDRLIVTEYDLVMSEKAGRTVTLVKMGDPDTTIQVSPDDVLLAGITNNVYLRYGPYYPGYKVYFNNADEINKSGEVRKNGKDVYIDYTVTMNATDETVNQYFQDIKTDWYNQAGIYKWNNSKMWADSMQAVFYDKLPDGWEYEPGSLWVKTRDKDGLEQTFPYNEEKFGVSPLVEEGRAISAPLVFFYNEAGTGYNNKNFEFFNAFSVNLAEMTFTYTLKATSEWLAAHSRDDDGVVVTNYAAISDREETGRWDTSNEELYFPDKLTKEAKQVEEGGNLLQFTLDINPEGRKFVQDGFDEAQSYLFVTDKSENLQVMEDTIQVLDAQSNEPLNGVGRQDREQIVRNNSWGENDWGTLPPDEEGQFKLVIPNGRHLIVTYQAVITVSGDNVQVSNAAGIEGVERSKSNYNGSLQVQDIKTEGSAHQYSLNFIKADGDTGEGLAGAGFKFYVVLKEDSRFNEYTDKIKNFVIDGVNYRGYSADEWAFTTGEGGRFAITKDMNWLEPGSYYILEETDAPEGYMKLEEPILFYFGLANDEEAETHPGAKLAIPNGSLTVENTPIQALRVVKKGSAGEDPFPLEGAQFQLCEAVENGEGAYVPADGGKSYTGQSKGEQGSVRWDGSGEELKLTPDKYYILTETKAPDGYILVDGQIVLYMTKDGKLQVVSAPEGVTYPVGPTSEPVFEIAVTDPSSYELPESGGAGTMMLYALGGALVLSAAIALVCDGRRRKARG